MGWLSLVDRRDGYIKALEWAQKKTHEIVATMQCTVPNNGVQVFTTFPVILLRIYLPPYRAGKASI